MSRRYRWHRASHAASVCLAFGTSLVFGTSLTLAPDTVLAQSQGTTVVPKSSTFKKTPSAPPADSSSSNSSSKGALGDLRPSQDVPPPIEPNKAPPPPPVQAEAPAGEIDNGDKDAGAGWETAVEPSGPTPLIGAQREEAIAQINTYFNNMDSLQGTFRQVDSDNKVATGRFYVKRPGRLRFDYAPPSPLRIVSDGAFLAIEDSDLKTVEKYPIKSTPFRLLLSENVDVGRDSNVLGVSRSSDELSIELQDRQGGTGGTIKLVFDTKPEFQLSQWVITDAQGLTTQVALNDLAPGRNVAADFFKSKKRSNGFNPY